MSFTIKIKKESVCKKRKFCIYHHELTMEQLDEYILQIMFDEEKLNYLFEPNSILDSNKRKKQLGGFIEGQFKNHEKDIKDEDIKKAIEDNKNPTYFSFFAEALLARLNIDYLDKKLITGVLTYGTRVTDGRTGADVCMFSEDNLVLGEAKFYENIGGGLKSIIEDGTFISKLESLLNNVVDAEAYIALKGINGDIRKKTFDEIKKYTLILSGFVLHTMSDGGNYDIHYDKINSISIKNFPDNYEFHLYHLPISSKKCLIFKVQRKALDLITELQNAQYDKSK